MKTYARGVWNYLGIGSVQQEAKTISLPKGESLTIELYTTDDAGISHDLRDATFEFRLVNPLMPRNVIYRSNGNDSTDAQLRLGHATIPVTLPGSVEPGTYHWDIWMTIGSSTVQLVPLSAFLLLDSSR